MAVQMPSEEFVVEGAKMSCNKGSKNAIFTPPADRRMTILGGRVGIETDTSPEKNFEGDFGKCAAMGGKPCIKDFIDTWFLAEPSVSYSSGQAAPSNNEPPAVSPKEEGHLLLTSSILVCWRGGHITFSDSGQKLREFDTDNPEWMDEKVHIIIRKNQEEPLLESFSNGDSCKGNEIYGLDKLFRIYLKEEKKVYDKHPYDFKSNDGLAIPCGWAQTYLPFVFEGRSTDRIFDKKYQETQILEKDGKEEGSTRQDDMEQKIAALKQQILTAEKLYYMLNYQDPKTKFNEDQQKKRSLQDTIDWYSHFNYGLWGKWYSTVDGWHRGIDSWNAFGSDVYAICDGYVIYISSYYINIYNPDLNVTVTYMHCQRTALIDEKLVSDAARLYEQYESCFGYEIQIAEKKREIAKGIRKSLLTQKQIELKEVELETLRENYQRELQIFRSSEAYKALKKNSQKIKAGEKIATQAKLATSATHTHVEINPGFFYETQILRPGASSAGYVNDDIDDIQEADPQNEGFSMNPYLVIEQIWGEREL